MYGLTPLNIGGFNMGWMRQPQGMGFGRSNSRSDFYSGGATAIPDTYNRAVGGIPQTPNPIESATKAITGAGTILPDFRNLYGNVGSMQIGGDFPALQAQEYANISALFGPPDMREINRRAAETGTGMGIAGAPAQDILSMFMTDREKRARTALASQLFSQAAARQPLNIAEWLPGPSAVQGWQDIANVRGAAPVPADAFNLNMQLALAGLQQGGRTQSGQGGGGFTSPYTPPSSSFSGGYKGPNADRFQYGTPTLPNYGGYAEAPNDFGTFVTRGGNLDFVPNDPRFFDPNLYFGEGGYEAAPPQLPDYVDEFWDL